MASQYKLIYFDTRGLGELPRLVFHAAGQSFTDERLSREQFAEIKDEMPFGQVPVLEINGEKFAQSRAIANHLAREFGLYGKTSMESLQVDQAVFQVVDVRMHLFRALFFEKDPARKEEMLKTLKEETMPKFFSGFEKLLAKNNTGFFVGSEITLADIAVFDATEVVLHNEVLTLEDFPLLKANMDKVRGHPKLATYLSERKPL